MKYVSVEFMKQEYLDEVNEGAGGEGGSSSWLMKLSYVFAGTAYFIAIVGSAIRVYGDLRFERSLTDLVLILSAINIVMFLSFFRWRVRAWLLLFFFGGAVWLVSYYMMQGRFS